MQVLLLILEKKGRRKTAQKTYFSKLLRLLYDSHSVSL